MSLADHHDIASHGEAPFDIARGNLAPALCRLLGAVPFAAMLAATVVPGSAFAQCATPDTVLCAKQTADQARLLSPFNLLRNTAAGVASLNANLQTDNGIYLNATGAQKIASSTILVVSAVPANVLLRAFPGNPNYFYNAAGLPTAPVLPASIVAAVGAITFNAQLDNIKSDFGISPNIYGHAYGLLPGQTDSLGNPSPYQASAAIHDNPFTAANSSAFAAQNQQAPGTLEVNWQGQTPGGDAMIADFPSAHTMLATFDAITAAVLAPGYYQQLARSVEDFAYDLNVFGVHYPLDVIGGRILGTYVLAHTLSGNPLYPSTVPANLASLSQAMQALSRRRRQFAVRGGVRRERGWLHRRRHDP